MRGQPIVERTEGAPAHAPAAQAHALRIQVGEFGPWRANAYLIWDGTGSDALILDPGMGAAPELVARLGVNGLRLHLIANSHGHIDHIFDNAPLKRSTGAPLAIHAEDVHRLSGENAYGLTVEPSWADRHLGEGEQLAIGDLVFDVLHTPGHTQGSVCLYEERHGLLLSGDVLFAGSFGRTDLPGGSDEAMVASLKRLARDLPPEVRVLPGHGAETTIGREWDWMMRIASAGRLLVPG